VYFTTYLNQCYIATIVVLLCSRILESTIAIPAAVVATIVVVVVTRVLCTYTIDICIYIYHIFQPLCDLCYTI